MRGKEKKKKQRAAPSGGTWAAGDQGGKGPRRQRKQRRNLLLPMGPGVARISSRTPISHFLPDCILVERRVLVPECGLMHTRLALARPA